MRGLTYHQQGGGRMSQRARPVQADGRAASGTLPGPQKAGSRKGK